MVTWYIWIGIYVLGLVALYCLRKWLHLKRMNYTKERYVVLEEYLSRYQTAMLRYDDKIYRSDKAYPVLTSSIIQFFDAPHHGPLTARSSFKKFEHDRDYLQSLVPDDIGINPIKTIRFRKRYFATQWLEQAIWVLIAILTAGMRVIWTAR